MKKSLVKLLSMVLCVGLLTGCGKEQEVVQRNVTTEESGQTEKSETKTVEDEQPQSVDEEQPTEENDDSEQAGNQDETDTTFHIDDTVIFDEEGVTVILKDFGYDSDIDEYYYTVNVDNNNPDNRKVSFEILDVSLNGFSHAGTSLIENDEILAGDCKEYDKRYIWDYEYRRALNVFEETPNTFPIEIVGIYYGIRIGSDSKYKAGHTFIKTSNYKDGNWDKLYGDKICEENIIAENSDYQDKMSDVSVYLRDGKAEHEDGIAVKCITVLNSGDLDLCLADWSIFINGEYANIIQYGLIGHEILNKGENIVFYIDTPENIRRKMELSNDELLDVSFRFTLIDGYDTAYDYEVHIP